MQPPADSGPTGVPAEADRAVPKQRLGLARRIEGRAVRIERQGAFVPPSCACCGADAATARAETAATNATLFVPYCELCRRHASTQRTRTLAVALASSLLALTLAGALPLVWERVPLAVFVLIVMAGTLLPVLAAALRPRSPEPGHSSAARAAWWLPSGELACTNPRWAAELARANDREARPAQLADSEVSIWMLSGIVVAVVALAFFYRFYRPLVRVVNLTDSRLVIHVDGEPLASVDPTSAESSAAGVELRIPAGQRSLEARDPSGSSRSHAVVMVRAASTHLYAPASERHCFWIEHTGYGRAAGSEQEIVPLLAESRFWTLPDEIDSWFSPNPLATAEDERSTGGVLTALRQAPCSQLPRAAERAHEGR